MVGVARSDWLWSHIVCWQVHRSFSAVPNAVRQAREFCADALAQVLGSGDAAQPLLDDARIVVSELVTNAATAGAALATVGLVVHRSVVRIAVTDDAAGVPRIGHPSPHETHGRGLLIVAKLARASGVSPMAEGKQVWAELPVPLGLVVDLDCVHAES